MSFITLKIKRGTTTEWANSTKILAPGELGLDTTLNKIKAGNGSSLWSALPFLSVIQSEITEIAQDAMDSALIAGTGIFKNYNDNANTLTISVDNTIANKTYVDDAISGLGSTAAITYVPVSDVGNPDGVASLDEMGKIPDSEIPSGIIRDSELSAAINNLINSAPGTLDTLGEIATALAADESAASALTTLVNTKAPIASPTFTGTVSGITKNMVGLGNVDNTTDALKPISTATQTALDLKLNISEPAIDIYITNSGSGGYLVNGVLNGTINFKKGKKYRIIVNAPGHPFWIQTVNSGYSAGNIYSTGITNAGTDNGSIIVELPQSAPDNLYYVCQYHSMMRGSINSYLVDVVEYATSSAATSYTISSANSGRMTEFTSGADVTITIPNDASDTTWPIGSSLELRQMGAGRLIFSVTSPATIVSTDGYLKTRTQYSSAFLEKRASNSWILTGDIDA
jgi:hypothetical protein